MDDLAKYSRVYQAGFTSDPLEQAYIEGMRAVFWRIFDYAKFSSEELFRWKARRIEETNG